MFCLHFHLQAFKLETGKAFQHIEINVFLIAFFAFFKLHFSKHLFKDENTLVGKKEEVRNCGVPHAEFFLILLLGK